MISILVGLPGSGKTTIREHLEAQGWVGFEASTYITRAMRLYEAATLDELPAKAGPNIAARMICEELENLQPNQSVVISGFRSPNEINRAKALAEVTVIGLYLSTRMAYDRIKQRRGTRDNLTFTEFKKRVEADYNLGVADILHHHTDAYVDTARDIEVIVEEIKLLKPTPSLIRQTQETQFQYPDRIAIATLPRV
ncbi:MAG TPA: AAA family ATPase [Streptosporangiaceae bacterium]|jgi:adenylate kinase family enzyme